MEPKHIGTILPGVMAEIKKRKQAYEDRLQQQKHRQNVVAAIQDFNNKRTGRRRTRQNRPGSTKSKRADNMSLFKNKETCRNVK